MSEKMVIEAVGTMCRSHVGALVVMQGEGTGHEVSPGEAMEVMTRECVRHLPVLRAERLDGIVSMGDLVRWTVREQEHTVHELTEYVAGKYPG
jgi:CBS domain-containing protein